MKPNRIIPLAVAGAFAVVAGSGFAADDKAKQQDAISSKQQSAAGGSARAGSAAPGAPLIVLVPVAVATTSNFADGCWVRLHDSTDFKGNQLSLVGPVDMPNMRTAFGTDWSGQFDSLEVGPKATLSVFDNENYTQKAATFKAGQKVKDLDEKMGTFEQIRSVKVACAAGGKTAQSKDTGSAAAGSSGKEKK